MASKKALTDEQRKRASWMQHVITAALADPMSPQWRVIDTAWERATRYDTQTKKVIACIGALRSLGRFLERIERAPVDKSIVAVDVSELDAWIAGGPTPKSKNVRNREKIRATYDPAAVLYDLTCIEPLFGDVAPDFARPILKRADLQPRTTKGGNGKPGAWNTLARLAHACGALGCTRKANPKTSELAATVDRWQKSGAKEPAKRLAG